MGGDRAITTADSYVLRYHDAALATKAESIPQATAVFRLWAETPDCSLDGVVRALVRVRRQLFKYGFQTKSRNQRVVSILLETIQDTHHLQQRD